jgi:ABC-2 type transport system ATP-binding protein
MNPAIEAKGLTKRFGELTAVDDLSLTVERAEILGFLGPNGAGKTTTTRILAGMIAPTSGYAQVLGLRSDRNPERLHRRIGLLTETPGFYERMSATENLLYFAGFYDIDGQKQVKRYLKRMGLWERRDYRVSGFSKGMLQKLALARALIHEPEILFLDEPTAGLDPEAAREVRELIGELQAEGHTVFLSTHNLEEAEQLCNRIALIRTRLLVVDSVKNLKAKTFRQEVVVELTKADDRVAGAVQKLPFVLSVSLDCKTLSVEMVDAKKNSPKLVRSIVEASGNILSVIERSHSLEDLYLHLIKEEEKNTDDEN